MGVGNPVTAAFIATKIPTNLRVDVPVASRATLHYASCQLLESTTVAFRATTMLSTVGVDIPDCSFQSYLKIEDAMLPVNCLI